MSFFNNIFSIKEHRFHYVIRFLGIKFKIISLGLANKELQSLKNQIRADLIPYKKKFLWSNEDKYTYKEKEWFLSTMFYEKTGFFPNLKEPKSFNEKLNWMKLNYYNPNRSRCVNKYEFKNYIKEKLGDGYIIPLIGVYDDVNDIDFDKLPEKFVIKTTSNGGSVGVDIIKDKSKINIDALKFKYNNLLQNWSIAYYDNLSNTCKGLTNRIIIEKYIEQLDGQLNDYKFHCFHGEPKFVLAVEDRDFKGGYKLEFVDMNWKRLPFHRGNKKNLIHSTKPKCFDEMVRISKILSKDFPFVRVDFYEVDNKLYIGELTFNPCGGFGKFAPVEWDYKIGKLLDLNKLEDEYLLKEYRNDIIK